MGWGRRVIACLFAWVLLAGAALAFDESVVRQAERALEEYRADIQRVAQDLKNPALAESQLTAHRDTLENIRARAVAQSGALAGPIAEVNQQLVSLGPAATDGRQEPETVAKERADLQAALDRLSGAKSRLDVIAVEAEQLTGRISTLQRDDFFQRIFEGGRSIFNPRLWLDSGLGIYILLSRIAGLLGTWWNDVSKSANFLGLFLVPVFFFAFAGVYVAIRRWLARWTNARSDSEYVPDDITRLWRIVRGQITTIAILFVLLVPITLALKFSGFLTPRFTLVYDALMDVVSITLLYYMLARRIASPGLPAWRVIDLDESSAARVPFLVGLAGFLSISNEKLVKVADALFLPVNHTIGQSALSALVMLVLLALIVLTLRNQEGLAGKTPGRRVYFGWTRVLAPAAWVLIATGFLALLSGYLALANYIAQQLFQTGMVVVTLFLLHHLSDAAVAASFDPQSGFGRFFRKVTGFGERAIERLGLMFRTGVDIVLVVTGMPLLLALWTFTWVDFRSLMTSAMIGLRIGDITLSPRSVIMILVTLGIGILVTKLIIGWFDRRILSETRIDKGVQDSLRTGASYAGYFVAALVALSAAGLDFSNLAIIAGALGVGIGFGLQSIANNFVSGLILLAERPVRVGDWVVLPAGEGLVKQINVRSTEIETFDSCSIIVPNSMLITEPVRNWTHGDTMGRFTVAVTVDYSNEAEMVRDLLAEIVRAHPKVLTYPEPMVVLVRFGPIGIDLEARGHVADVMEGVRVASELRFTILREFREKGITIPHPVGLIQSAQK